MKKELDFLPPGVIARERPTVRDLEVCMEASLALTDTSRLDKAAEIIKRRYHSDVIIGGGDDIPKGKSRYWVVDFIPQENASAAVVALFHANKLRGVVIQRFINEKEPITYIFSPKPKIGFYEEGKPFLGNFPMPKGLDDKPVLINVFESMEGSRS